MDEGSALNGSGALTPAARWTELEDAEFRERSRR